MIKKPSSAHFLRLNLQLPPRGFAFPHPGSSLERAKKSSDNLLLLDLQINARIPGIFALETIH